MNTKITIIKTFILLFLSITTLTACSNHSRPDSKESKAALYNAQLGAQYTQKGRYNLANEKLLKALEQDPQSAEAHHYYAILQQQLGESQIADRHFRRAMAITPKDPQLLNNYGSHLCRHGNYATATQHFLAALNDPLYTTPEFAYTNAGICIKKSGDNAKAEEYFRKSLALKPTFGSALFQMAKVKYEQGDFARAQAFIQRYHESSREGADSLLLCAQINTRLGDLDAANQCNNKLAGRYPNN